MNASATKKECNGVPNPQTKNGIATADQGKANLSKKQFKDTAASERLVDVSSLGQSPYPSCPDITFTTPGIINTHRSQNFTRPLDLTF